MSPLLANVYLHEVLDRWFEADVKPRLVGRGVLIRYADDAAMVFSSESDARKVMAVLTKRFARYGLTLHPEKTRLVAVSTTTWRNNRWGQHGLRELRPAGLYAPLGEISPGIVGRETQDGAKPIRQGAYTRSRVVPMQSAFALPPRETREPSHDPAYNCRPPSPCWRRYQHYPCLARPRLARDHEPLRGGRPRYEGESVGDMCSQQLRLRPHPHVAEGQGSHGVSLLPIGDPPGNYVAKIRRGAVLSAAPRRTRHIIGLAILRIVCC